MRIIVVLDDEEVARRESLSPELIKALATEQVAYQDKKRLTVDTIIRFSLVLILLASKFEPRSILLIVIGNELAWVLSTWILWHEKRKWRMVVERIDEKYRTED